MPSTCSFLIFLPFVPKKVGNQVYMIIIFIYTIIVLFMMHYGKKNPLDDKNLILFDLRHFCMNSINRSQSHFVLCKTVATPKWTTVLPDKKVFKRDTTFKRFAIKVLSMYFYLSLFSPHTMY